KDAGSDDERPPRENWWDNSLRESRRQLASRPTRVRGNEPYLENVARVYREAFARGDDPTKAVQHYFGLTRSTAGRHVLLARDAGKLNPTSAGVAGEAEGTEQ